MHSVYLKTKIHSGEGSLKKLSDYQNKKILIICDRFLMEQGSIREVLNVLHNSNTVEIFCEVEPDAPMTVVSKALAVCMRMSPDFIIAYGGGSAIDTAKGMFYFAKEMKVSHHARLIAVPTTSGTGSEVTSVTVITDTQTKIKHVISDDEMFADEAILDANLTLSLPPDITANTGMDVLTHALEAYVATGANVYTDAMAEKAVELVRGHLHCCYQNGRNIVSREKMHEASTLAGISFNLAGLGIAHSIAHQLGGIFKIPHGLANSLVLEEVIRYNCSEIAALSKYAGMAHRIGLCPVICRDTEAVQKLTDYISHLRRSMNMPLGVRDCGISKHDFESAYDDIAVNAMKDRCTLTNPVEICERKVKEVLENIY